MALLSIGSDPKTVKGRALGWETAIHYGAPYTESGYQACPMATKGCAAACLFHGGRGAMPNVRKARIERTRLWFEDRALFVELLSAEIYAHVRRCERKELHPAVRLNGMTDIPFERQAPELFERFEGVQFYDYTKRIDRLAVHRMADLPPNYHLTVSRSETNEREALACGANVAVVFGGKDLPDTWHGRPVVDGDLSDLRFLDPPGSIVGLRAKGKARADLSGFVVHPNKEG